MRDVDRVQRLAWIRHYEATGSAGAVCTSFGISRPTFRKWLRRFQAQGPQGLDEPSRKPVSSPNRKVFAREEGLILSLRREGRLGVHKIRAALRDVGIDLSSDTILKVLRRADEPPLRRPSRIGAVSLRPEPRTPLAGLAPVDGESPDRLAEAIAALITDGRLRPGQKLSESVLGGMLGVGRAGVRSALQRLAPGGLVVLQRNRGAFVNNPSIPEVEEAYAARRLIESEIVADVCRHCTAHDVRMLRRHVDSQTEAQRSGARGALIRSLSDFHVVLASLGENRILADFVKTLVAKTSLAVVLYDHVGSSCAIEEHAGLIDLMAAGDVAGAQRLMVQHLTANQRRLPRAEAVEAPPVLAGTDRRAASAIGRGEPRSVGDRGEVLSRTD
jgi:DNA-binding GntR family transcriptional regulator/transposase